MRPAPTIMITRPRDDALSYQTALQSHGFQTHLCPLLEIKPLVFNPPVLGSYQGLVFTSSAGVHAFARWSDLLADRNIPVFTVGDHTAEIAQTYGFNAVMSANGSSADLPALVYAHTNTLANTPAKPYLYVRGTHVARALVPAFQERGLCLEELTVYSADPVRALPLETINALETHQISAVTFFSKRTAETFIDLVKRYNLTEYLYSIKALCISQSVLECVRVAPWGSTYGAHSPNGPAMLALLESVVS